MPRRAPAVAVACARGPIATGHRARKRSERAVIRCVCVCVCVCVCGGCNYAVSVEFLQTHNTRQVGASVCVIFSSNATCLSLLLSVRFLTSPKPGPYFGSCNDNSYLIAHEPDRALCTDLFHLGRSCAFSTCRTAKEPFVADTLGAALPPGRRLDDARHA